MTMEDCIIEVDDKSSPEDLSDWHREVTLKLFGESGTSKICNNLEYALQEYNRILKTYETNRGVKKILKDRILDHVKTFHSFLPKTSIWTGASTYIETMENVLIILCNLELEIATNIKISDPVEYSAKIMEITERIVYILPVYLLGDNVGICHVLLKLRPRFQSRQWKDIMRVIYRHFLVMLPVYDKSKENFCRNYLLFQNLKAITNKKDHLRIDALLYSKFGLTSDVLKTNQKIRRILRPLSNSIIDLVDMLTDHRQSPINNYFKYMAKKKKEKETPLSIYLDSESEEEDVPHFTKKPSRSRLRDTDAVILVDDDNIKTEAGNNIICLDDDSDCEVMISPSEEKCTQEKPPDLPLPSPGLSFLDLIAIPNKTISTPESPPYSIETERSPASDDQFQSTETNFEESESDKAQRMEESCTSADALTNEFLELSIPSAVEDKVENAENEAEVEATKEGESQVSSEIHAPTADSEAESETRSDHNNGCEENEPADVGSSSDVERESTDNLNCVESEHHVIEKSTECLPNAGYNFMHGLITPPKSDRISDDVVTGAKNVYVPDIMRIDSICYDGFENLPLIAESAEDNSGENKRHEESQSYESYESPEELQDQNLELHESINISDMNDSAILNAVCEESSGGDILGDIVSDEQQLLDSPLFEAASESCVGDANEGPSANCGDLIDDTRTGGSESDFPANATIVSEPEQVSDKIIFTSSEKLSAPLALFSKFEQLQSELVENACSGPLDPFLVNSSEHSNSNDGLADCAISPCRPFSESSPTSPPFEQINTRDYQIHLDRYLSSRKNGEVIRAQTDITAPSDRKKKLGEDTKPHVPKKVRFDGLPRIESEILSEAKDSLTVYNISRNDAKLVFLEPQIPIRIESMQELKEKEEVLKIRSKLYSSNNTDSTFTIKRVDYKRENGAVISHPEIRHPVSNLIHNKLGSTVEGVPSGYTPTVNGYTGFRYNYETTASNNASYYRNYVAGVPNSYDTVHTYIPSWARMVPRRGRGRPTRAFQYHPEGPT